MDRKMRAIDTIEKTVAKEFTERYGEGTLKEHVIAMKNYKSLPITTATAPGEVGFILEDITLITKLKILSNGEKVPVYEIFGENGVKILETQDDGLMKFDKEIFEELIRDKIKTIQESGYDVAGIDNNGNIESFFEMINGKVIAINREQKERLDNSTDKNSIREDIDGKTADPEAETSEISEQEETQKMQDEQQVQEQLSQELGLDIHKVAKVDDPIFRMNNPQTRGQDLYVALTQDDSIQFITYENGTPKVAEGFKNSGRASGRTTKIISDQDSLKDNEVNTYGEIYPTNRDYMRYTVEKGQYGEIKLVEQIRYDGSKTSETDKWISREAVTSNTDNKDYTEIASEGAGSRENITARTFNQASQNTDANRYGHSNNKGGLSEIGKTMKEKKPTDTTMESFAADDNQRYAEAKRMVVDVANKEGASLDPDTEAAVDKRVQEIVDNMNSPFTEEIAEQVLIEIKMQMAEQSRNNSKQPEQDEQNQDQDEGRSRLEEEFNRKMGLR